MVSALANNPQFIVLAVTRDVATYAARDVSAKGKNVRMVKGDMNDIPTMFKNALAANAGPVWGVFSVQTITGKQPTGEDIPVEVKQGCGMVDEALKNGVKHFVYTSVERGGNEHSWDNPTSVPHFQTKHKIEHHLRDNAGGMGWTILRPTAFMDNLAPGFPAKVFMAMMRDTVGDKKVQWVATKDIGVFAKIAFESPDEFNQRALGLAGADQNVAETVAAVSRKSTVSIEPTFWVLGAILKYMVTELGTMVSWFAAEGYKADISELKRLHPGLTSFETWLEKESSFPKKP